jgi:glutathione S-transferase
MPELILHHYETSPFSQKFRWVLGMKSLAWHSVDAPAVMPKPDVVALTGGYRRIPFMQIGADIYCDTALMCRVVDHLHPEPPLYPASAAGLGDIVAQWADSALFWAAIPTALQPAGIPHVLKHLTPEQMKAFGPDRAAFTATRPKVGRPDNAAALSSYLQWLEAALQHDGPYLLGERPCIADVSVAQSIWFLRRAGPVAGLLAPFAKLNAWYERVLGFGEGRPQAMSSAEALAVAASAGSHAPCSVGEGLGFAAGDAVTIAATDYGTDPVEGTLVGLSSDEAVIERHDARAGTVHVHFPRIGFTLRKREA